MLYEDLKSIKNGVIHPDGSETTFDGTVIKPPSAAGVMLYNSMMSMKNGMLNPDGSETVIPFGGVPPPCPEGRLFHGDSLVPMTVGELLEIFSKIEGV